MSNNNNGSTNQHIDRVVEEVFKKYGGPSKYRVFIDMITVGTCVVAGYFYYRSVKASKNSEIGAENQKNHTHNIEPRQIDVEKQKNHTRNIEPRQIRNTYCVVKNYPNYGVQLYTKYEFQAYLERNIKCFDPTLILAALDLKPSNFGLLSTEHMTYSIMRRAFELDIENIRHLSNHQMRYTNDKKFVRDALNYAVEIHGFEKVSAIVNDTKLDIGVKEIWADIVSEYIAPIIDSIAQKYAQLNDILCAN